MSRTSHSSWDDPYLPDGGDDAPGEGPWCACEPLWTGEAPAVPDRHCPVHGEAGDG